MKESYFLPLNNLQLPLPNAESTLLLFLQHSSICGTFSKMKRRIKKKMKCLDIKEEVEL